MNILYKNMEKLFKNFNYENINDTSNIVNEICNYKNEIICEIMKENDNDYKPNIIKNIMSNDLCDLIINESEKYAKENSGWCKNRHKIYPTTDIPIKLLKNIDLIVYNYIIINIFEIISNKYNLNKYFIGINDLFIVKYEENGQYELEKHKDGSMISFNILLNKKSDFEGGGTIIETTNGDILYELDKGDLLLHRGNNKHGGKKIFSGKRYILVGFLSYLKNINNLLKIEDNGINLNNWFLKLDKNDESIIDNLIVNSKTQLLDVNKKNFDIIEKTVYELSMYHFKRLGIEFNSEEYFIEFWSKNEEIDINKKNIHNFHTDKDENLFNSTRCLIHPILSTVTYINENNIPTIITNKKQFNYNNDLEENIFLSFPKKFKHISFNGMYMHGVVNILNDIQVKNRKTLMINLWKNNKPKKTDYYSNNNSNNNSIINYDLNNNIIINIIKDDNVYYHKIENNKISIINSFLNLKNLDYLENIINQLYINNNIINIH